MARPVHTARQTVRLRQSPAPLEAIGIIPWPYPQTASVFGHVRGASFGRLAERRRPCLRHALARKTPYQGTGLWQAAHAVTPQGTQGLAASGRGDAADQGARTRPAACRQYDRWQTGRYGQDTARLTHSSQGPDTRSHGHPPRRWVRDTTAAQCSVPGSAPRGTRHFRAALRHRRPTPLCATLTGPGLHRPRKAGAGLGADALLDATPPALLARRSQWQSLTGARPSPPWRALSGLPDAWHRRAAGRQRHQGQVRPPARHTARLGAPPLATLPFIFLKILWG